MLLAWVTVIYSMSFLISIPCCFILSRLYGYLRIFIISRFILGITIILFPFIGVSLIPIFILMGILGFNEGLGNVSLVPLMGDIFDESAILNHKRSEGFFFGILSYVTSLIFFQSQSPPTFYFIGNNLNWQYLISFIPGIAILITMILFVKFYDLTPQKVKSNQELLIQLKI